MVWEYDILARSSHFSDKKCFNNKIIMWNPTSKKYLNFVELLERFRPWMEKERTQMSEWDFVTKYGTSRKTVIRLMWPCPEKIKLVKPIRNPLPIDEINKLRFTMPDIEIAQQYHTYVDNINKQCWTRKSLWIKKIMYRKNEMKVRTYKEERKEEKGLKTDRWETPEPTSYELSWMADAIDLNRPHPTLYTKLK